MWLFFVLDKIKADDWLIDWLIHWLIDRSIDWLIDWLLQSMVLWNGGKLQMALEDKKYNIINLDP